MFRLRLWLDRLRTSLWFVPSLIVLAAVVLAYAALAIDARLPDQWWKDATGLVALFDVRIGGGMATLQVVGTSIITIAGVVFSITIAAMTLASGQYTSRVLRNFIRDRGNQTVLGLFLGIFVYCLLIMRSLSGVSDNSHAPPLSMLLALLLAFVGIATLIYFIHHIAMSLQATRVVASIGESALPSVDRHFPDRFEPPEESDLERRKPVDGQRKSLRSRRNGYVTGINFDDLLVVADKCDCLVRVWRSPGHFVTEGEAVAEVQSGEALDEDVLDDLLGAWSFSQQRTLENDPAYGLRQLVDVALKALSPGVNETSTGVMCVNWIGVMLVRMSGRRMPPRILSGEEYIRIITHAPGMAEFIHDGFDQIRQNASGNVAVLKRQLEVLLTLASGPGAKVCRKPVLQQAEAIEALFEASIAWEADRDALRELMDSICAVLGVERDKDHASQPAAER
ncbi:MAG: DUF2254 domain-containing protein [Rhodanobacteraceae bacterium]